MIQILLMYECTYSIENGPIMDGIVIKACNPSTITQIRTSERQTTMIDVTYFGDDKIHLRFMLRDIEPLQFPIEEFKAELDAILIGDLVDDTMVPEKFCIVHPMLSYQYEFRWNKITNAYRCKTIHCIFDSNNAMPHGNARIPVGLQIDPLYEDDPRLHQCVTICPPDYRGCMYFRALVPPLIDITVALKDDIDTVRSVTGQIVMSDDPSEQIPDLAMATGRRIVSFPEPDD